MSFRSLKRVIINLEGILSHGDIPFSRDALYLIKALNWDIEQHIIKARTLIRSNEGNMGAKDIRLINEYIQLLSNASCNVVSLIHENLTDAIILLKEAQGKIKEAESDEIRIIHKEDKLK